MILDNDLLFWATLYIEVWKQWRQTVSLDLYTRHSLPCESGRVWWRQSIGSIEFELFQKN